MLQRTCWTLAVSLALLLPSAAGAAQKKDIPPDPVSDPLLITAGFLNHHQDLKYRLLGIEAYNKKDFENALRFFRRASYFADNRASEHLRFNVVFSQHVRLHDYLRQRLAAVSTGQAALAKAARAKT